jgi:CheY-like chemotaxis protein
MAREKRPDAITLDVMMPGLDGWAVLGAIKADPDLADIPVIMLTMVDDRNIGFALGANEYILKPIDRERLLGVLAKYRHDISECGIMVVDDDPSARDMIARLLAKEGCRVVEAASGREALELMDTHQVDLILLDLMMPEIDGFEFLRRFDAHEEWRDTPVVVITAKELSNEDRSRLNGHVERILQKGAYSRDDLLREVRTMVSLRVGQKDLVKARG